MVLDEHLYTKVKERDYNLHVDTVRWLSYFVGLYSLSKILYALQIRE